MMCNVVMFVNQYISSDVVSDFGPKWIKDQDEHKRKKKMVEKQKATENEKCTPPPAKRRKCDTGDSQTDNETIESPEGQKLVPGMNGLSVDFVQDLYKTGSELDESITSDCLPRGR